MAFNDSGHGLPSSICLIVSDREVRGELLITLDAIMNSVPAQRVVNMLVHTICILGACSVSPNFLSTPLNHWAVSLCSSPRLPTGDLNMTDDGCWLMNAASS